MKKTPMMCPRCRIAMNHHAEKLIEPRSDAEAAHVDPAFGALIQETHTCPNCGRSGSRLAY